MSMIEIKRKWKKNIMNRNNKQIITHHKKLGDPSRQLGGRMSILWIFFTVFFFLIIALLILRVFSLDWFKPFSWLM